MFLMSRSKSSPSCSASVEIGNSGNVSRSACSCRPCKSRNNCDVKFYLATIRGTSSDLAVEFTNVFIRMRLAVVGYKNCTVDAYFFFVIDRILAIPGDGSAILIGLISDSIDWDWI